MTETSDEEQKDILDRIANSIEGYVNDRIETDKVLTGVLKSISQSIEIIDTREELKWTFDKVSENDLADLTKRFVGMDDAIRTNQVTLKELNKRIRALEIGHHVH